VPDTDCKRSISPFMSSFHDQIFSEIDAARKLAAEFASRHAPSTARASRLPSSAERQAQEAAAAAEIAALAAEEERLACEAQERAKVRAEEQAKAEKASSRWNALAILKGLAKLRAKERSAAEALIRKAQELRDQRLPDARDHEPDRQEPGPKQPAAPIRGMWSPSLGASQVWYFTSGETRCGPVTFGELRTMAASRVLDPRLDMVWKEGMEGWKQAGLLDGLFERRSVPAEMPETREGKRPWKITALPRDLTAALATKYLRWPGIGRLTLLLGLLLFPLLWSQLLWWSTPLRMATSGSAGPSMLLPLAQLVPVAVILFLVLMRLTNVGMSRWWALMLAIPILNLWVGFRCLVCPAGYAHHRKLDRAGRAIALAVVLAVPTVCYITLKHPGLLSPEHLQTSLHRLIERAGKMIPPWEMGSAHVLMKQQGL
jgi:uncharacterized membrane protein YhaH (DUF805 family)